MKRSGSSTVRNVSYLGSQGLALAPEAPWSAPDSASEFPPAIRKRQKHKNSSRSYNGFGTGELEQIAVSIMRTRDLLIADDPSIPEIDVAIGVCRDVGFVRDDDRGDALQAIEMLKDRHNLDTRARVERAGRFAFRCVSARDGSRSGSNRPIRKSYRQALHAATLTCSCATASNVRPSPSSIATP